MKIIKKMSASVLIVTCVLLIILALLIKFLLQVKECKVPKSENVTLNVLTTEDVPLVHNEVLEKYEKEGFNVDLKDSLDDQLDNLAEKLAEKEGCVTKSKSKLRQTQQEMASFRAIDDKTLKKYKELVTSLREELKHNERDGRSLQLQIEKVARRRAELSDQVKHGQRMYGEAAAGLASNLKELHRGRSNKHQVHCTARTN